ncbi:hypothetical protein E2C01_012382 [Portunus trituberculatus]|uniref:Uncharacterized protein n=1 Tax=Portunus trituberculatus TaxID=210409 RepID=A0A5B7DDU2_PORTR|nr:hypothetical protein [Portunus trituberculatus]
MGLVDANQGVNRSAAPPLGDLHCLSSDCVPCQPCLPVSLSAPRQTAPLKAPPATQPSGRLYQFGFVFCLYRLLLCADSAPRPKFQRSLKSLS